MEKDRKGIFHYSFILTEIWSEHLRTLSNNYVFAMFYFHYFSIEKIKKIAPQSAGKCISEGPTLKTFGRSILPEPPWGSGPSGLRPWAKAIYLHSTGEILSVTPASKLNDSPAILVTQ